MTSSFAGYQERMLDLLRPLSRGACLQFCLWCIDRFHLQFGDAVRDGISARERERLQGVLQELARAAETGRAIPPDRINALEGALDGIGPRDPDEVAGAHPNVIDLLLAMELTLKYCGSGDVDDVFSVAVKVLDAWDNHLGPEGGSSDLATLFTVPEMRRERELQEEWLSERRSEDGRTDSAS